MDSRFAAKLAVSNIKKNRKLYLPYVIASVGIIAMFYIMCFLAFNNGLKSMDGADSLRLIMLLGCIVLALFSLIFIFYINSFLMKRRKKEIGLYNILGMEKKHIARILLIENGITSIFSIVVGLLCGILFSKLIFMILCATMKLEVPIGFVISIQGVVGCAVVFGVIFLLNLLKNLMSVGLSKPIELLKGSETGEKEPKSRSFIAALGAVFLAIGYYIGITTDNPLSAIMLFFLAVILVIAGTYLLFISGSIAILKALRKNKKFYYKANHFTAVSGMLYRMKQNAVGLANICILSTMVLVMISTTVCLRVGIEGLIDNNCPGDLSVYGQFEVEDMDELDNITKNVRNACAENGVDINKSVSFSNFEIIVEKDGSTYKPAESNMGQLHVISVIAADQYEKLTGKKVSLKSNEVLEAGSDMPDNFTLINQSFRVKEKVDKFLPISSNVEGYYQAHYLVVADKEVLKTLNNDVKNTNTYSFEGVKFNVIIYSDSPQKALTAAQDDINEQGLNHTLFINADRRSEIEEEYYGFSGGFLFLGIFLGLVFTFAAALIIYYKQISEGYYDKDKFEIMQKVGMSKEEVRRSVKTQVLMVFFAPLAMAGIHMLAAFNLVKELLKLFTLYNVGLFALCTVVTFAIFAVIYAFVYGITAREYYKIIENR